MNEDIDTEFELFVVILSIRELFREELKCRFVLILGAVASNWRALRIM